MPQAANILHALKTGIPYTPQQMSAAISRCLCDHQSPEHCRGEDRHGNSVEIQWIASRCHWLIRENRASPPWALESSHDHFQEDSFEHWDPAMLLSICENLDLTDDLMDLIDLDE